VRQDHIAAHHRRLDADYEGEVHLPDHGRLGMVFQEPRLLPWRTLEQNVRLAAPQVTDDELTSLFAALAFRRTVSTIPGELSLGLARRVALARPSRSTPTCCCSTSRSSRSTTPWRRACATSSPSW